MVNIEQKVKEFKVKLALFFIDRIKFLSNLYPTEIDYETITKNVIEEYDKIGLILDKDLIELILEDDERSKPFYQEMEHGDLKRLTFVNSLMIIVDHIKLDQTTKLVVTNLICDINDKSYESIYKHLNSKLKHIDFYFNIGG